MGTGTATGGAPGQVHTGPGASPGYNGGSPPQAQTMAPPFNAGWQKASGGVDTLEILLRVISLVLVLISLAIVASIHSGGYSALDFRPFQYSLAVSILVLVFEFVLIGLTFAGALATPGVWIAIFVADQILAYLIFSANSITGYLGSDLRSDDGPDPSSGVCHGSFATICSKIDASTSMGFLAFPALAALAVMSGLKAAKSM